MKSKIKSILLLHPFGIGDALFMTPIIRSLHESGVSTIDLILGSRTQELFEHHPCVNEIFVMDRDRIRNQSALQNVRELIPFLLNLRKKRYQAFLDFSLARQYAFFASFFLNIPVRIGFNYKNRGIFLTHRKELLKSFSDKHVVDYYFDLLDLISCPKASSEFELFTSGQDAVQAREVLRSLNLDRDERFLVVAPGGGESWGKDARLKRWPVKYFFELIKKIKEENAIGHFGKIVILGGKGERELGESLRQMDPEHFYNLCGQTSLRVAALLIKHSRLFIGNDGGLVHIASAMQTPTVALFGPVDPKVYAPYPQNSNRIAIANEGPECRPCYQNMRYNEACQHVDCLNTLYPNTVFQTIKEKGFFGSLNSNYITAK